VSAYGKASIKLELLLSTALFIGREGFRLAVTKEVVDGGHDDNDGDATEHQSSVKRRSNNDVKERRRRQQIINVSWLSIPVGAIVSILALLVHLYQCSNNTTKHDFDTASLTATKDVNQDELWDYKLAGILYCLSSFIEAIAEPLVIQCLQRMDVTTKAKAEGIALLAKSLCSFSCTVYLNEHNYPVTAFGISQLVYATLFTIIMYHTMIARRTKSSSSCGGGSTGILWPKFIINTPLTTKTSQYYSSLSCIAQNNFHNHTIYLILIFTLQGIFKHALTEADKFILSGFSYSYDQGVYALVSSYGGLAARLLLQPMEENARLLFTRLGAEIVAAAAEEEEEGKVGYDHSSTNKNKKSKSSNLINDLEGFYYFFVRLVMYIGLVFAAFGSNYTAILLRLLAGNRWGTNIEACTALSAFCVYTAFLALNGITEAFVYGVARSGKDVTSMGIVHAIVGVAFALFAPTLVTKYGALGLIVANCISMVMRCLYSLHYIRSYFATHTSGGQRPTTRSSSVMSIISRMFPHIAVMMAFAVSFLTCRVSSIIIYDSQITAGKNWMVAGSQHIGVGLLCIIATLGLSSWFEKDMKEALLNVMKRKRE
jgi:oligosaccharide translocation protein RFT1